ncbi:DNA-binding protein [Neptunomonas japonica]|uniref:DNA-binding protein n=1 Tax=Neptunomonas japonica TaxID=417574 RepID=UPI0004164F76|nr:DNA-binding protein [Neptunomonas japonica]
MIKEQIYRCADRILTSGEQPTPEKVSAECQVDINEAVQYLSSWKQDLSDRISFARNGIYVPDVPDSLSLSFGRIWQQAVDEASSRLQNDQKATGNHFEEAGRVTDDTIKEMQYRQQDLENRLREQNQKNGELAGHNKAIEAELSVLKTGLASETTLRKQEEQVRSNVEHELAHLRKTYEDSKRTFDQRIKDEQRHMLDSVSKADVDVRYYKNALEKLRDEVGKKESALTKSIHDIKAELAKKDVKIETQRTQLRSQEAELKLLKQDVASQSRELARCTSSLLAETNKSKRFEDKGRELDNEIKRLNQKQYNSATDWSRRENSLRKEVKDKEDELLRTVSRLTSLEKRIIAQDEELRRLNSRL